MKTTAAPSGVAVEQWNRRANAVEQNPDSSASPVQRLKAEIAAILSKCDHVFSKDTFVRIECSDFDKLRQFQPLANVGCNTATRKAVYRWRRCEKQTLIAA